MEKSYGIFLTACLATTLAAPTLHAASVCKQYEFIYQKEFTLGDGEGMETRSCKESNFAVGDSIYMKIQPMVNAGQHDQARKDLERALGINQNVENYKFRPYDELCVRPAQAKAFESLMQQIGKNKAAELERSNKHDAAIATDINYCLYDDAARLHIMLAEKNAGDIRALKNAMAFTKQYSDKTFHNKILAIANAHSKSILDNENKFFTNTTYNPAFLSQAIAVFESVDDTSGKNRVLQLAASRGDTLAKQDSCHILTYANEYYKVARLDNKIQSVKARAQKLGADMEKQNNPRAAGTCYAVAGDNSRAEKMSQAIEARSEKAAADLQQKEPARKAKFNKEQDDMEKELGL